MTNTAIVDGKGGGARQLTDLGQVRSMDLPGGWLRGRQEDARYSLRDFNPPGESELVRLSFYCRGVELDRDAGSRFQEILAEHPHILSAAEIKSVSEVLRHQADARSFRIQMVWTAELNGKTILITAGHWCQYNQSAYTIYIDACGNGCSVQEIYFTAPPPEYARYIGCVQKALTTIQWK